MSDLSQPPADGVEAGRRLSELRRTFAEVQALAGIGSWSWDTGARRGVWSDELCRIFGLSTGSTPTYAEFLACVHPEDRHLFGDGLSRELPSPPAREYSYRIIRPDGDVRHVVSLRPEGIPADGQVQGVVRDVTAERRAEIARNEAQALFEMAFDQAAIGMALVGLDGRFMKVNAALCRIVGWPEQELLGRGFHEVTHPEDLEADLALTERLLAGEIPRYQIEKRYVTREGEHIWALLSVSLARGPEGEEGGPRYYISQIEDISRRKRAENRLVRAEAEARVQRDHATAIITAMHEGYGLTIDGEIKEVNDAFCEITGFTREQLVGLRPPYPFWPPETRGEIEEARAQLRADGGGVRVWELQRADGERFEAEITSRPAHDGAGLAIGFVNTLRDVSAQRRHQRELERLARTDSLTGLANRYVLEEALDQVADRRAGDETGTVALVLLDVDRFKRINDLHGHPVGDEVLVEVAARMSTMIRGGEVLARVGGEEFGWLLRTASEHDAIAAADRCRKAISDTPIDGVGSLTMSAGVGVMSTPVDASTLYRMADRALYDAKAQGRDRTCWIADRAPVRAG